MAIGRAQASRALAKGLYMPNFSVEKPATLTYWRQQFGILMTIATTAYVVVLVFSLIFGPSGGAP
jgi:hypothetical protein